MTPACGDRLDGHQITRKFEYTSYVVRESERGVRSRAQYEVLYAGWIVSLDLGAG